MKQNECPFYRSPESLTLGIGYCDINHMGTMCDGAFDLCEKPKDLTRYLQSRLRDLPSDEDSLGEDPASSNFQNTAFPAVKY